MLSSEGEVVLVFHATSASKVVSRQAVGPVNRCHMPETRSEPRVVVLTTVEPPDHLVMKQNWTFREYFVSPLDKFSKNVQMNTSRICLICEENNDNLDTSLLYQEKK